MKKRWLLTSLFALALCIGAVSAQAAVVSGDAEYVWYTDMGQGEYNEDGLFVSSEGQKLYLSADQGGSYAELPGLREAQQLTGLSYVITVEPNAANDGGLSVKARDIWSTEYTWRRDYSAQEIAAVLKNAVATPVEVFATNGTVTVGTRYTNDYGNVQPGALGNFGTGAYQGDHIVYSTDGVTWFPAEGETACAVRWERSIWWDGEMFWSEGGQCSADGIHWAQSGKENLISPKLRYSCELGDYHFEVVNPSEWQSGNDVYLMRRGDVDTGVLLPDLGNAIRAMGIGVGDVQAWYTPNDTVTVAFYDYNQGERYMYSLNYPISSLEWCLDNLSVKFRDMEVKAASGELGAPGTVALGVISAGYDGYYRDQGELVRYTSESGGWQTVPDVPWGRAIKVLPYNGKTFLVQDTVNWKLYASVDGLGWSEIPALWPEDPEFGGDEHNYLNYAFAWSERDYIACRKAGVRRHGMMGHAGGQWYGGYSEVYLLNENFELVNSYDFGRLVQAVGFYNGNYYAQVANSNGHRDGWVGVPDMFDETEGSALYRSADGKSWEKLPDIYIDYADIMISTKGGSGVGNQPTGAPNKPLRMVAQLGQYRFALKEIWGSGYTVGLMMGNAQDWMELEGLREAIQSHWILPGEVSARYTADGNVEVTVTDLSTPSMTCSVTYSAAALDESLKAGVRPEDGVWDRYHIEYPEEEQSKPGVADVAVMALPNGEKEIVYRTAATNGKYMYYDSVPWSNSVVLLPFSGKDFMVLDKATGKVYLSADGVSWHEATGDWVTANQAHNYWEYAFVWTGEHYLGVCTLEDRAGENGQYRTWSDKSYQAVLLDENLDLLRVAADFGDDTTAVGYKDGVSYVEIMRDGLNRSTDGVNWEAVDVLRVRDALVGLQ